MDRGQLLWLVGLGALACLALGAALAQRMARALASRRGRAYNVRGQRGERAAERLLRAEGYRVIARQIETRYPVTVDADVMEVALHADFLVARAGRRLVAEVKTGRSAPRFEHADTRRQLLEYQLAFGVDSVLLVDIEAGALREVCFPLLSVAQPSRLPVWLAACALAGMCVYWLARA